MILAFLIMQPSANNVVHVAAWTLEPPVIAVMLLQVSYWGAKTWTICRLAVIRFVAHISYALYLYHGLAGEIVYVLHVPHLGFGTAALTLLMSTSSYYFVERPFMRMRDRRTKQTAKLAAIVEQN